MRFLFFCLLTLLLSPFSFAQEHIYFAHVQPKIFTDLYVTPDEKLVVVKSDYNVLVLDAETGKRLHRWILPQQNIQMPGSQSFYSPLGIILNLPNNFLEQYGPDVHLLATDGKRAKALYLACQKSYGGWIGFNSQAKKYQAVPRDFVGYGWDGRAIYAAGGNEDGCPEDYWKYRKVSTYTYYQTNEKGERQVIESCARGGQVLPGGRYFFYITNEAKRKNPAQRWLMDLKTGKVEFVHDIPKIAPLIGQKKFPRYARPYYNASSEAYLLIGPSYPPTETRFALRPGDYLYRIRDGKLLSAKAVDEIPENQYVSARYRWQAERIQVEDETGRYEATGIRQYDRSTMQPVGFIQLTKAPQAQALYDSIQTAKKDAEFAAAVQRREARKANAIAAAQGKTNWKYEKETNQYYDQRSTIYAQYTTEVDVAGKLCQHIAPGDEVYLMGAKGSRFVQEVDRENNVLVFGRPGATARSQNETQYLPLIMNRVCLVESRKVDVGKTVDCPVCLGGKVETGRVIDRNARNERPFYFSGYDSNGRATYSRKAMTKPVYGTCGRCGGAGELSASKMADRRTYRCLNVK
ncbi:MAG: hypothetical protein AAFV78_01830 [Bacteroidota bacterium]